MAQAKPQTLANHGRVVPGFHMVTALLLVLNLLWAIYHAVRAFSLDSLAYVLLSVATVLLFVYTRNFATGNQDRIIRLEERLRIARLARDIDPERFTTEQLVALRFASDRELPELCRKVLNENLSGGKRIKELVREWRADYQRV